MAEYNVEIWRPIAARLARLRQGQPVDAFLAEKGLVGIKWRLVENERQGISVDNLIRICKQLDVSADWLLGLTDTGDAADMDASPLPPDRERYLQKIKHLSGVNELPSVYQQLRDHEQTSAAGKMPADSRPSEKRKPGADPGAGKRHRRNNKKGKTQTG